jgi:hypothetical protein
MPDGAQGDTERDALKRRGELGAIAAKEAAENGYTFAIVGSADKSLEIAVIDSYFAFWQYQKQVDCATIPPAGASAAAVYAFYDKVESLNTYSDQELAPYVPNYYQASVQLGSPEAYEGKGRGCCSSTVRTIRGARNRSSSASAHGIPTATSCRVATTAPRSGTCPPIKQPTATVRRWAGLPAAPQASAQALAPQEFPGFDADLLTTDRPRR